MVQRLPYMGPSGILTLGSSTIPLLTTQVSSDSSIDGFDTQALSSFIVIEGKTLSAAAAGATISDTLASMEAGGDIGTGRFALPTPMGRTNGSINVQAFRRGQNKGLGVSLFLIGSVWNAYLLKLMM